MLLISNIAVLIFFLDRFLDSWNLPICLGAVDGKYIHIRAPDSTGSLYFNYKKSFSITLMAVAGPDYKFLSIDVGHVGSVSDSGVWAASSFGQAWTRGENTNSFGCKFFQIN